MKITRRQFLKTSAAATAASALSLPALAAAQAPPPASPLPGLKTPVLGKADKRLNILMIGGTGFTGPEQVEYALARGHKVTLLNRNKRRPDLFKDRVDMLVGDLNADVSVLKGRSFDVVLDIPTTAPYWVRNVAQHLKGKVGHYVFISTVSVYPDHGKPGMDETAETAPMPADVDPYSTDPALRGSQYAPFKAFCERLVQETYPVSTIIRPGLIVGPLDPSDRFTYWPSRIDRGGEVLAPGDPNDRVQFIDARDLAEWTIHMIEQRETGVYNALGPASPLTVAEMLYGIKAVTTAGAQFTWASADFLQQQKIEAWKHMPVWIPPAGELAGFHFRSNARAVAKGLKFRPLAVTALDTLEWNKTRPPEARQAQLEGKLNGLAPEREAEVLAAWKARPR
ncbi:MAG: NAD-dependent epimerase/dehydratase family protein [Candidatus Eisenbacteria bacterium]|nr:NAD-dependent epimerase/dehydratase family protein [Candidatus Eisenbacteria bacterium]